MSAWTRWNGQSSITFSAVYADLQTNFPRQLMELQDHPWAQQLLFMSHRDVYK